MVRSRPVGTSKVRPRAAAALLAVVVSSTACSGPDLIDGHGTAVRGAASGTATARPAASATGSPASTSGSASGSSTSSLSPGLALLRELRAVSTANWQSVTDPRTGTSFSLPTVVPARTTLQNGISQRIYEHKLSEQSTISVSYVHTPSVAAAKALLGVYPSQLQQSVRALGVDDAEIAERRSGTLDGNPSLSFRFGFTPPTIPQIPPNWLVTAIAKGADIVLAQTIVFPPTPEYAYLRLVRDAQQRLTGSLRLSG